MALNHIRSMSPTHWALLAACLGGIGVQLGGMHSWAEVFTPQSIGGAMVIFGTQVAAIFTPRPQLVSGNPGSTLPNPPFGGGPINPGGQ